MRPVVLLSIAVLALASLPAHADFPCTDAVPAGIFPLVDGVQCEEYPRDVGSLADLPGDHRIVYPDGWLDSPHRQEHIRLVRAAYLATFDKIDEWRSGTGWTPIRTSTVLLGVDEMFDLDSAASTVLDMQDFIYASRCLVLISDFHSDDFDALEYQQAVSHELIHCFQDANNPGRSDSSLWWADGTAHYLSNEVFRSANLEHGQSPAYDPSRTPFEHIGYPQQYATGVLFQHIGNVQNPSYVIRHSFGLPRDEVSADSYHRMASGWPGIGSVFHSFAKAFYDRAIRDSGGGNVPVGATPAAGPIFVIPGAGGGSVSVAVSAPPFRFEVTPLPLDPGTSYRFTVDENDVPGQYSVKYPNGNWGPFLDEIITACEGEGEMYYVLPTSTATPEQVSREDYTITLNIDLRPRDDCEQPVAACDLLLLSPEDETRLGTTNCGDPNRSLNNCLVGKWQVDVDTYQEEIQRILPIAARFIEVRNTSTMVINDDGVVEACVNFFTHMAVPAAEVEVHTQTAVKGSSIQKIEPVAAGELCTVSIQDSVSWDYESWIGDPSHTIPLPGEPDIPRGALANGTSRFECTSSTLTIYTAAPGVGEVRSLWHRAN